MACTALATSVGGLMFEASRIENFATEEVRRRVCHAHRRILEAIEAGEADRARKRVERDVAAYARELQAALAAAAESATPAEAG